MLRAAFRRHWPEYVTEAGELATFLVAACVVATGLCAGVLVAASEPLQGVFGARLRITSLRPPQGPGVEFLECLAPRDGRPAPADLRSNDLAHWQTRFVVARLDTLVRSHGLTGVSPGPVSMPQAVLGFSIGADVRDRDGHALQFVAW